MHEQMISLILAANNQSDCEGKKYCFKGDLCQMAKAKKVAEDLEIEVGVTGGIPFVMNQQDYDAVTQHIIENRIDGWWHYVTNEEYKRMK